MTAIGGGGGGGGYFVFRWGGVVISKEEGAKEGEMTIAFEGEEEGEIFQLRTTVAPPQEVGEGRRSVIMVEMTRKFGLKRTNLVRAYPYHS